jgi:hypothetical protein
MAGKFLIRGNGCRLDEELVAASSVGGRILLHRLEENCAIINGCLPELHGSSLTRNIKALTGLDAACIWSDTVSNKVSGMRFGRFRERGSHTAWERLS